MALKVFGVKKRFGHGSVTRRLVATRLERVYRLVRATGDLRRFVVFGSFITEKADPNDIDVFLVMEDTFDVSQLTGASRLLFDHATAQANFGASVFRLRRLATLGGEEGAITLWEVKRDGSRRGLVEIVPEVT